jgi:hypothetical protein
MKFRPIAKQPVLLYRQIEENNPRGPNISLWLLQTMFLGPLAQKTHLATRDVFTAMKIQVVVFWVVTPCSDVIGPCYPSLLNTEAA